MRRVGWIFVAIAFATAWLAQVFGSENVWLLSAFGITIVLGFVLVASTSAARLYRGDVRLRPWDAAKKAFVIFMILLALRLFASAAFGSTEFDLAEAIIASAGFALVMALYTTAYRKPV